MHRGLEIREAGGSPLPDNLLPNAAASMITCAPDYSCFLANPEIVAAEPASASAVFVFANGDSGARVYDRIVTRLTGHEHPALFWISCGRICIARWPFTSSKENGRGRAGGSETCPCRRP